MNYNQLPPSYLSLGNQLLSTNRVPNPFYNLLPNHPQTLFNQPLVSYSQLLKPFPQYTSVSAFRKPQGNSLYHSFILGINKRFNRGLTTQITFTAAKPLPHLSPTAPLPLPAAPQHTPPHPPPHPPLPTPHLSTPLSI